MKWRKRLLLLALFAAVFAGTLIGGAWWMARGQPEWYSRQPMDPRALEEAAGRAERQMERTLSWAEDQQAFSNSSSLGAPTTHPAKSIDVSFTEDELNGFFRKWDSTFGWSNVYQAYASQPEVALRDGRLIFAATVTGTGSVLSVEFIPRLEDGKLWLSIGRVLAGKLPLPATFWEGYRRRLQGAVEARLPDWRQGADIGVQGGANTDAVAAAMGELLLDVLRDEPSAPVLFLPHAMRSRPRSLPVNVTELKIEARTLTLTVEPLDAAERIDLLKRIRASENKTAPK